MSQVAVSTSSAANASTLTSAISQSAIVAPLGQSINAKPLTLVQTLERRILATNVLRVIRTSEGQIWEN